MFLAHLPRINTSKHNRGFTLIELMVSISIIVLITGVVLVQYSSFNSSVLLTSQAYKTAFDLRETQSLGISVRGDTGQFRHAYGIYFDSASSSQYIVFIDNNDDGKYDTVHDQQVGKTLYLDTRFKIADICTSHGSSQKCANSHGNANDYAAVTFKRPNFDAIFTDKSNTATIDNLVITFSPIHDSSAIRTVTVAGTGQISVQ